MEIDEKGKRWIIESKKQLLLKNDKKIVGKKSKVFRKQRVQQNQLQANQGMENYTKADYNDINCPQSLSTSVHFINYSFLLQLMMFACPLTSV